MHKTISGKKLIKFLSKKGFIIYSKKSSHIKMINSKRMTKTIVPMHKELATGTLTAIIKQAKLSKKEIDELMQNS